MGHNAVHNEDLSKANDRYSRHYCHNVVKIEGHYAPKLVSRQKVNLGTRLVDESKGAFSFVGITDQMKLVMCHYMIRLTHYKNGSSDAVDWCKIDIKVIK